MKIEVKNVSKKINNLPIIRHANITFESGKIYGIVGETSSGKSVFLNLLSSFYKVDEGEILQDGYNYSQKQELPKSTRYLTQNPKFIEKITGFENLKEISKILNEVTDEDIYRSMKLFDIYKDKDISCEYYLYNMKQKLALASTFMEESKMILLDDPFNCVEKALLKDIKNVFKN